MAEQSDLQKWLNELKKRAGSPQGGSTAQRRYQPPPPPKEQPPTARPEAPRPLNMAEYLARVTQEESPGEVDFTRAVSIKEQQLRKQEELSLKEERRRKLQARAAKSIRQQQEQIQKEEEELEQKQVIKRARLKEEATAESKPSRGIPGRGKSSPRKRQAKSSAPARKGIQLKKLHRHLGDSRTVLREAVILSEILGKPKSIRQHEGLWE